MTERFLLEWLAKEDWSSYGECHGEALDALIAKGYVRVTASASGREDYAMVILTEAGRKALQS